MGTPRKHWFRVADSILNEPWTNDELAALIRLMAYLNTRWARSGLDAAEACEAEIPTAAVMQITGRGRADVARRSLEHLAVLAHISVQCSPKVCSIKWPKWSIFQELRTRDRPGNVRESPCPHPQTHTHTQREEKKETKAPAPTEKRGPQLTNAVLEEIAQAFAAYGKKIVTWSESRRKMLRRRAKDHDGNLAVLASAVHGYAYYHRGNSSPSFDPLKHLVPETVYRVRNFPKYLDAAHAAIAAGETPPFNLGPETSKSRADRLAEDIERGRF